MNGVLPDPGVAAGRFLLGALVLTHIASLVLVSTAIRGAVAVSQAVRVRSRR